MFPTSAAPAYSSHATKAYRQVGVQSEMPAASPHRLIAMLFEGLFDQLNKARGALREGQVAAKCKALSHAVRILEEGLRGALDQGAGGKLASDLDALYDYAIRRLTLANVNNDEAAIEECVRLLLPLKTAWDEIGPQVEPRRQP
ncbi:MAG TPA: flagellar export chaperone FliS [Burkholderiaceae bacterium]|nr:flagellar export chaperone FliS [Burkholderiaceae bacterium]